MTLCSPKSLKMHSLREMTYRQKGCELMGKCAVLADFTLCRVKRR